MIVLLIISILVLFLVERWSIRHGLDRITYDVAPSQTLLEPDEEFTVRSTIENHKLWFVPYVSMVENFPSGILIPGEEESLSTGTVNTNIYVSSNSSAYQELASSQLTTAFDLMPRQRLTRTLQAKLPKRGRYLFLGCRINGGDLLGLQDDYRTLSLFKEVVVMPRRAASPSFDMLLGGMIGDISVNRFIFEDPMLTIGFSDYTGREPMRDISWTQSARLGRMMVKNYDHTIDLSVTILLNVQSVLNVFEEDDKLEECCSIARSVCEQLEAKHIQYSFLSNAIPSGTTSLYTDIEQGLGSSHFYGVMEFLGRVTQGALESFSFTLQRACRNCEPGRHHIIITPSRNPAWQDELLRLQELSDGRVFLLTPDDLHEQSNDGDKEGKTA